MKKYPQTKGIMKTKPLTKVIEVVDVLEINPIQTTFKRYLVKNLAFAEGYDMVKALIVIAESPESAEHIAISKGINLNLGCSPSTLSTELIGNAGDATDAKIVSIHY